MTIKVYELMRLAKESPDKYKGKKYKATSGRIINADGNTFNECYINDDGDIVVIDFKGYKYYAYLNSFEELEEIKEPVDFMTAVKAFEESKTIYRTIDDKKPFYFRPVNKITTKLLMETEISIYEILNGKWYIED